MGLCHQTDRVFHRPMAGLASFRCNGTGTPSVGKHEEPGQGSVMASMTTSQRPVPSYKSVQYAKLNGESDEESSARTSSTTPSYRQQLHYKVYPWRWFMLFSLCFQDLVDQLVRVGDRRSKLRLLGPG